MSDAAIATGLVESPVFLQVGDDTTFAIVTHPPGPVPATGFIILPGGGTPLTTNRNRLSVRICRSLASIGFLSMRCDYHGTGESTGSVNQFRLDQPFVEDVAAAVAYLRDAGAARVILAGSCFGGRTALATAAVRDDVAAVMLVATSPRDYLMGERIGAKKAARWGIWRYLVEALRPRTWRGMFNARMRRSYAIHLRTKLRLLASSLPGGERRIEERPMGTAIVSPHFERDIRSVAERGVPVLLLYGSDDEFLDEFRTAAAGPLAEILERSQGKIQVREIPGRLHGLTKVSVQEAVFEEVLNWAKASRTADEIVASSPSADGRA